MYMYVRVYMYGSICTCVHDGVSQSARWGYIQMVPYIGGPFCRTHGSFVTIWSSFGTILESLDQRNGSFDRVQGYFGSI